MHLFDLGFLPRYLTDPAKDEDDETPEEAELYGRRLYALYVALLPVGMRVISSGTPGLVVGWTDPPNGPKDRLYPYLSPSEPRRFLPLDEAAPFVRASSTYLPALRAQIIVSAATMPHLCKLIAESFGALNRDWKPRVGESFGIQRQGGRWTIHSTHGAAWTLDFGRDPFPPTPEEAVSAILIRRIEEIADAYIGREPEGIV
jgi:hypothetical protein